MTAVRAYVTLRMCDSVTHVSCLLLLSVQNMHFIGTIMLHVCDALKLRAGSYTHHVVIMVSDRA